VPLAETGARTEYHDDSLARYTKEINQILLKAAASKKPGQELRLVRTPVGLMLAWARTGAAVGAGTSDAKIKKALQLA
jgi:hypothetical protein